MATSYYKPKVTQSIAPTKPSINPVQQSTTPVQQSTTKDYYKPPVTQSIVPTKPIQQPTNSTINNSTTNNSNVNNSNVNNSNNSTVNNSTVNNGGNTANKNSQTTSSNTTSNNPVQTPKEELPTFDLQAAQEAEAKLASGQIQTLGQKTPEQQAAEEAQKQIDAQNKSNAENLTPTQKSVLSDVNTNINAINNDISSQQQVLQNAQSGVETNISDIQKNIDAYAESQKQENIAYREKRLLEIDKQLAELNTKMTSDLAALGISGFNTEQMNASTRQIYNAYLATTTQLQAESSVLSGNLKDAKDSAHLYYSDIDNFLTDKLNNYQSLLDSSGSELNRLTGDKAADLKTKMEIINSQIDAEKAKKAMYDKVLSAPIEVQNRAKNTYGLSITDDANTQYAKLLQAQIDTDNINALIKEYPDLIGKISPMSTDAEIATAISNSGLYNAALEKSNGDPTKDLKARATFLSLNLATKYPQYYSNSLAAYEDASKIAALEYTGVDSGEAMQRILNEKTSNQVSTSKQLDDMASSVIDSLKGFTDTTKKSMKTTLSNLSYSGNYLGWAQDLMTKVLNGQTGDIKNAFVSSLAMMDTAKMLQTELQKFYADYGTNAKLGTKFVNGVIEFFGDTTLNDKGKAELARINALIKKSIFAYTKRVSGAQFTQKEFERYKSIFPDIKDNAPFNDAKLQALVMEANKTYDSTMKAILPPDVSATIKTIMSNNKQFSDRFVNIVEKYGANNVVLNTLEAAQGLNGNYINRIKGGQCGAYVNQYVRELGLDDSVRFGDSIESKMEQVKKNGGYTTAEEIENYTPKVGDIIVQRIGDKNIGHVAIVSGYDSTSGNISLLESNYYHNDETVSIGRTITKNAIAGILPITK